MEARPPAQNRHGGAPRGARPSGFEGRGALRKRPDAPRHGASNRVPLHPGACRRSAHPSVGLYFTTPGAIAPRERTGLFDIVRYQMRESEAGVRDAGIRQPGPAHGPCHAGLHGPARTIMLVAAGGAVESGPPRKILWSAFGRGPRWRWDVLNRTDRSSPMAGEAEVKYLDGDFRVVRPGAFVRCAVTGLPIPLEELKYWSVDLQEPYANPDVVLQRQFPERFRRQT